MSIVVYIVLTILLCVLPAGVVWLCNRVSVLGKLGPIMVLYAVGMVVGNLPALGAYLKPLQDVLPNVMIPLAIPMMLYGSRFSRREAGLQLRIVVSGFLSVCVAVTVGYLLFGHNVDEGAEVGGIITGMYTGGTLNAAALQVIFRIKSETFILINSYDIIISFLYFVFLFSVGIKMFRALYGQSRKRVAEGTSADEMQSADMGSQYHLLLQRSGLRQLARIVAVTLVVVAVSALVALAFSEEWFMVVFILMLTMLGVASSFVKSVREMTLSYDVGMYLIYIFSLTIASMADFSSLDLRGGINQFAFMTVAVILSLLIHAVVCRLMRVNADSMMISSVAFINSPPFVPMAAVAMRNKSVIVTGLGAGIMGYALGNHLGVLMSELLSIL
ncbi:MAG: DUF819 family protein [Alistipes sp.]|nr:DUF819 family protein [Alistipes sp.]